MSRSFKKTPGFCDSNPYEKNQANRKVRHARGVPNGAVYKKLFESWDIHDWKNPMFSWREVLYWAEDEDRVWRYYLK